MLFRLFRIRKTVREVQKDAGGFAGDEVVGLFAGLLMIPVLLVLGALILFFLLGFTTLIGGPFGLFKVLFIVGAFVSFFIFIILRPIVLFFKKGTKRVVDQGIKTVRNEFADRKGNE